MPESGDYILLHFVDKQPLGSTFLRERNQIPLHMTLVSWFRTSRVADLEFPLDEFSRQTRAVDLQIGGEEQFGPHKDVPVNVIANPEPVRALHDGLLALITEHGGVLLDYVWSANNYRPHITRHDAADNVQEGDVLVCSGMSLVRLEGGNTCKVVENWNLNTHETAA